MANLNCKQARTEVGAYFTGRGYKVRRGSKNTYFTQSDGKHRYKVGSRTVWLQYRRGAGPWMIAGRSSVIHAAEKIRLRATAQTMLHHEPAAAEGPACPICK